MIWRKRCLLVGSLTLLIAGCSTLRPRLVVVDEPQASRLPDDSPDFWRVLTAPLNGTQIVRDGSFEVVVPRSDIDLESEMGEIPTSAGIESHFYFFRCPCGKIKTMGDFLACDYESNDVIDALRRGGFTIVSLSPILQSTRPVMVSIRFQAEGEGEDLVRTLQNALRALSRRRAATQADGL